MKKAPVFWGLFRCIFYIIVVYEIPRKKRLRGRRRRFSLLYFYFLAFFFGMFAMLSHFSFSVNFFISSFSAPKNAVSLKSNISLILPTNFNRKEKVCGFLSVWPTLAHDWKKRPSEINALRPGIRRTSWSYGQKHGPAGRAQAPS